MIYAISHWYCLSLPCQTFKHSYTSRENLGTRKKPQWAQKVNEFEAVDILDLNAFILEHGPAVVRPPTEKFPHWRIIVTDKSGQFTQK